MPKTFYKLTDKEGNNVYAQYGKVHYELGKTIEVTDFNPSTIDTCGAGLHVCKKIDNLFDYIGTKSIADIKVWEVSVNKEDIVASGENKTRVKKLKVVREVSNKELYGPDYTQCFDFINKLSTLPYFKPAKYLDLGLVEQLGSEHFREMNKLTKSSAFDGATVKLVKTWEEYAAQNTYSVVSSQQNRRAVASAQEDALMGVYRGATCSVGYGALYDTTTKARGALYGALEVANCAASYATEDIMNNAKTRPWAPLVEIFALGCVPALRVVDMELIVWVP